MEDTCNRVLFINPFGIGDVLFTTPIIHTLKDLFPNIKIGYLCNKRGKEVLEGNPYVDSIFVYERDDFDTVWKKSPLEWIKKMRLFIKEIKSGSFDLVLDFSLNTQYGFFAALSGIKRRVGFDYKRRGIFLTDKISLAGYENKHVIEYYADFLTYLGLDLKYRQPEFYLSQADRAWAEIFFKQHHIDRGSNFVAIIPGAGKSWGKQAYLKHWPAENFARLSDKLIEKYKVPIIILGDSYERDVIDRVMAKMRQGAIDLCGKTTLGQFAAILNDATLVITNDGGPLHIAAALGKKTISFFGPVSPKVYGPYPASPKRHIVLYSKLDCRPCYRYFRMSADCKNSRECLDKIDVEQAMDAVGTLFFN